MIKKLFALLAIFLAFGTANAQDDEDIFEMSLEELMSIEITSASKKAQNIKEVPSSIYVITSQDIERSGATNIMELLREVPGFWAVSNDYLNIDSYIRNSFEGSVLILLDGTPLLDLMFASFQYHNFDIPLSQIDRIEVIKGSGGTIYGANSASGVISIFTKDPENQSKVFADVRAAFPGYADANLGLSGKLGNKLSANVYGKVSHFGGFDQLSLTEDPTSTLETSEGSITINNRFTEDDQTVQTVSGGLGLTYKASDRFTLSGNLHANAVMRDMYNNYFPSENAYLVPNANFEPIPDGRDSAYFVNADNSRFVANLKGQFSFSDTHNLFARVSTNAENSYYRLGGGFQVNNNIIDFEIQDNFQLGINEFSVGGNFRLVNYDINDIYTNDGIRFTEYDRTENLTGLFLQDKINIVDGKLAAYLGIKAENFSLINDKFYFSPMAKVVLTPSDQFTLWGGYTQSYTTPGYNQTDIELSIFRAPSPEVYYNYAYPLVYQGVYQQVYQEAVAAGADDPTAQAMADAFVTSPEGMATIDAVTNAQIAGDAGAFPGHFNVAGMNGPDTEPASFSNFELGVRLQPSSKLYLETNLYLSLVNDAIHNSDVLYEELQPSPTRPGENVVPAYYGNYVKATNYGAETVIKYMPSAKVTLEASHSMLIADGEIQANNDFNIENVDENTRNLDPQLAPIVPEHVFRAKAYIDLPGDFRITVSGLYSTAFFNRLGGAYFSYNQDQQHFDPLYNSPSSLSKVRYGEHDYRLVLNARIDKYFLNEQLNVFVYGNDLAANPFVESATTFQTVYPRQIGRMAGFGVSYRLK